MYPYNRPYKYTQTLSEIIEDVGRSTVESWFMQYDIDDYLTREEQKVIATRGTWNKQKLAAKIVDNYYLHEIGYEDNDTFKHYIKIKLREIMESKLPMIYSAAIKYDPLVNVDYKEIMERTVESESEGNSSGLSVNSDTPQGQISKSSILAGTYASSTGASESESEGSDSTEENYTKHIVGNSGVSATAQRMVQQYRECIVTIDNDIINELSSLFQCVYDGGY